MLVARSHVVLDRLPSIVIIVMDEQLSKLANGNDAVRMKRVDFFANSNYSVQPRSSYITCGQLRARDVIRRPESGAWGDLYEFAHLRTIPYQPKRRFSSKVQSIPTQRAWLMSEVENRVKKILLTILTSTKWLFGTILRNITMFQSVHQLKHDL